MELSRVGSFEHTMILKIYYDEIHHLYAKHGPEIMACKLEAIYSWLRLSHGEARVFVHKKCMDRAYRQIVLYD